MRIKRQMGVQVIGFNKQIVKFEFVGFVPPIVGRGYDPAAHVPMREMYRKRTNALTNRPELLRDCHTSVRQTV